MSCETFKTKVLKYLYALQILSTLETLDFWRFLPKKSDMPKDEDYKATTYLSYCKAMHYASFQNSWAAKVLRPRDTAKYNKGWRNSKGRVLRQVPQALAHSTLAKEREWNSLDLFLHHKCLKYDNIKSLQKLTYIFYVNESLWREINSCIGIKSRNSEITYKMNLNVAIWLKKRSNSRKF